MTSAVKFGLWPRKYASESGGQSVSSAQSYPVHTSARQALGDILRELGFARSSRVALPEWSSACVIGAVGTIATPLPIREALLSGRQPDAVLIYEQWGWSYAVDEFKKLSERWPRISLILDKVDSPNLVEKRKFSDLDFSHLCEIWSLAKILGLSGGGIARIDGEYLSPLVAKSGESRDSLWDALCRLPMDSRSESIIRTYLTSLPPDVKELLNSCCVKDAIKREANARKVNIERAIRQGCLKLSSWMEDSLNAGAAPGIVPLYSGASREKLNQMKTQLSDIHGIETEVYHFNLNGSLIDPEYEVCLAFPVHGGIDPAMIDAALLSHNN